MPPGLWCKVRLLGEVPLLAIGSSKIQIQIKVISIELERPLALDNCLVDLVVGQEGGGGNVADDGRQGIQCLSFEHEPQPFFQLASEQGQQRREEVSWGRVGIELQRAFQLGILARQVQVEEPFRFAKVAMCLSIFLSRAQLPSDAAAFDAG